MPTAELTRFATYCRAMAATVDKTIAMAAQDVADATAAAREGDTTHPLPPAQTLYVKRGLEREHRLWLQLADEIDNYLGHHPDEQLPDTTGLVDLFTHPDEERD